MRHLKSILILAVLALAVPILIASADPFTVLLLFALILAVALTGFLMGLANGRHDAGGDRSTAHQPPTRNSHIEQGTEHGKLNDETA